MIYLMNRTGSHGRRLRNTALTAAASLVCLFSMGASGAPSAPPLLSGFVNDLGHHVSDQDFVKPYRLVIFGYTTCPDVCPLTLVAVHRALATLGTAGADVDPVFVTVDPDRDTVDKLHQYVTAFDAQIRGYRSSDEDLDRLTKRLHVRFWREALTPDATDYWMSHTSKMFLIAADNRVLATIEHVDEPNKLALAIVAAVQRQVKDASPNRK